MPTPLEHDYIGLTEPSSSSSSCLVMERSPENKNISSSSSSSHSSSTLTEDEKIKETELRLGLPGSHSPERKPGGLSLFGKDLEEKHNNNNNKRGFSDAIDGSSGKWVFSHRVCNGSESEADLGKGSVLFSPRGGNSEGKTNGNGAHQSVPAMKDVPISKSVAVHETKTQVSEHASAPPAAKAQLVGWPPIRSFRKITMASNLAKNIEEETQDKSGSGCLYVKVSMDGAPYLRKVDLKTSTNYRELSLALEKMFSCFTIGQCSASGLPERKGLTESRLMDLLHGSEYVVTYEDKDGDWMLVGDVPWDMFTDTCRRLRIMKGSEAIGLAPRAMEKCKNQN